MKAFGNQKSHRHSNDPFFEATDYETNDYLIQFSYLVFLQFLVFFCPVFT